MNPQTIADSEFGRGIAFIDFGEALADADVQNDKLTNLTALIKLTDLTERYGDLVCQLGYVLADRDRLEENLKRALNLHEFITNTMAKEASTRLREWLAEEYEEVVLADGLDEALIGIAGGCSQPDRAVYDTQKVIEILMNRDKMTEEDAWEWFVFNIEGAYIEAGPLYLKKPEIDQYIDVD